MRILTLTCFLIQSFYSVAQPKTLSNNKDYDTDLLPVSFFLNNRNAIRDSLPKNSVAVIFANPIQIRSNDINFEFHQNPNFFYITGYNESDAVIIIFKEEQHFANDINTDEILFMKQPKLEDEKWTGKKQTIDEAVKKLKIRTILANEEFFTFPFEWQSFDNIFVLNNNINNYKTEDKFDLFHLISSFNRFTSPLKNKINSYHFQNFMAGSRQIKQNPELVLMQKAIQITSNAQIELMKAAKVNMKEYQAEAIVEYVFKNEGSEYPGFPSILGGGENSCFIHYDKNRKTVKNNELLVCDIGAEYHNYNADVTRTFPINGKFTQEQKLIYNIVLAAQKEGIKNCIKGNKFWDPHDAATKIIAQGLLDLGIIDKKSKVTKYFIHGTSHYLGLDVHDLGLYGPLQPGNVITVEPGIYIPAGSDCDPKWWNIGIRIEDDILITASEPENLSENVPREINEIEALMKSKSKFDN